MENSKKLYFGEEEITISFNSPEIVEMLQNELKNHDIDTSNFLYFATVRSTRESISLTLDQITVK